MQLPLFSFVTNYLELSFIILQNILLFYNHLLRHTVSTIVLCQQNITSIILILNFFHPFCLTIPFQAAETER